MDIQSIGNTVPSGQRLADNSLTRAELPMVSMKPAAASVEAAAVVQQPAPIPSLDQVTHAVQNINKTIQALAQNLEFTVDPDSNRTVIKVIDQQTKEVIRQMPSAEALEIAKALDKVQGLLIRQKA